MAQTKVSNGTSAKRPTRGANAGSRNAKPTGDFSAELTKLNKPAQTQKKPSSQKMGPEILEDNVGSDKHLKITDSPGKKNGSTNRLVDIEGQIYRFNKQGDIIDGGAAHAGRVKKVATVTVTVTDRNQATKKSYKGDEVRPMVVELGQDTREVRVHGEFAKSMTLAGKAPVKKSLLGSLDVFLKKQQPGLRIDAVEAQFVGRDAQSRQNAQLTANVTSTGLTDVVYLGSKTRDTVNIQTRGRAVIHAGSGDDVVMAKAGQRSEIKGNDGNDTIMVQGPSASVTYEGGKGRDTFDIPNPKAAEQIIDFDPSTDVDRSEVE